jgi:hypothetical protein
MGSGGCAHNGRLAAVWFLTVDIGSEAAAVLWWSRTPAALFQLTIGQWVVGNTEGATW